MATLIIGGCVFLYCGYVVIRQYRLFKKNGGCGCCEGNCSVHCSHYKDPF